MKKALATAVVCGMIAAPSFVLAQRNADISTDSAATTANTPAPDTSRNNTTGTDDAASGGTITRNEAIRIARQQSGDKTFEKVEIENEDGAEIYSVRFTDDSRVDVRASDGTVVRSRDGSEDQE